MAKLKSSTRASRAANLVRARAARKNGNKGVSKTPSPAPPSRGPGRPRRKTSPAARAEPIQISSAEESSASSSPSPPPAPPPAPPARPAASSPLSRAAGLTPAARASRSSPPPRRPGPAPPVPPRPLFGASAAPAPFGAPSFQLRKGHWKSSEPLIGQFFEPLLPRPGFDLFTGKLLPKTPLPAASTTTAPPPTAFSFDWPSQPAPASALAQPKTKPTPAPAPQQQSAPPPPPTQRAHAPSTPSAPVPLPSELAPAPAPFPSSPIVASSPSELPQPSSGLAQTGGKRKRREAALPSAPEQGEGSDANTPSRPPQDLAPFGSGTPRGPPGAKRDVSCLGCVRSGLAGSSNGVCQDRAPGVGGRCFRCTAGKKCEPLPYGAILSSNAFLAELQNPGPPPSRLGALRTTVRTLLDLPGIDDAPAPAPAPAAEAVMEGMSFEARRARVKELLGELVDIWFQ
ncbi:hypothetical protein DDE82_009075 [Stemphylium lycopersici]|uniref:Uncharacterized protein n=1 Tax=Stemphylium lycopersici TaxID=183478 RepID=A0A364MRJ7_STELY|nr:hypothetical protein TW65_99369 [Stemphylium lycopersici]RAQ98618.1 hypothetical protein DDE82_009075 [Stemphylium lycopersici]RAR00574.1 hypothetical protein DDE83_009090 [Stemphylium lycopersici]